MSPNEQKLHELLAKILSLPVESITNETSPDTTPSWDSFNGLVIASDLETTFQVKFSIEEIVNTKNVGDIKTNLRGHGISL